MIVVCVQSRLQQENERQSIVLGGARPPQGADSDDDASCVLCALLCMQHGDARHVEVGPPTVDQSAVNQNQTGEKRLADLMKDFTAEPDFEDEGAAPPAIAATLQCWCRLCVCVVCADWEHQEPWGGQPPPAPDRHEGSSESDEEAEEFFNAGFPSALQPYSDTAFSPPQSVATHRQPGFASPEDSGSDYDEAADEEEEFDSPPKQHQAKHVHVATPALARPPPPPQPQLHD